MFLSLCVCLCPSDWCIFLFQLWLDLTASCYFAVNVQCGGFWPPAKVWLTCSCGQHEHTLSHADRGQNHGDKGQPPPHTGHLETNGEKKIFVFCDYKAHMRTVCCRKTECRKEAEKRLEEGVSLLFHMSSISLKRQCRRKKTRRSGKRSFIYSLCLSYSRPQITFSGSQMNTDAQGRALSAFSQSWCRRGLIGFITVTTVYTHTHTHRVRGVNSVCKSSSSSWSYEGRGDWERSSTFPSFSASFNLISLPHSHPVCLHHSFLKSPSDTCCSELKCVLATAARWHLKSFNLK